MREKARSAPLLFTRSEGEQVLVRVEPKAAVTAWQLYALPLGHALTDGSATLYDVEDLALARLAGRMRQYLPGPVVKTLLAYHDAPLRRALRADVPHVFVVRGRQRVSRGRSWLPTRRGVPRGEIVPAAEAPADGLQFALSDLLTGLEPVAREVRLEVPGVWNGYKRVSTRTAQSSLVHDVVSIGSVGFAGR